MGKTTKWAMGTGAAVIVILIPHLFGIYYSNAVIIFAVWALFAVSLNLLLGFTGLLSFGHAMFFGTGAYATALALTHIDGLPLLPAILAGFSAAVTLSLILAPLVVRVSGTAFAMLHLAFAQLMYVLALKLRSITGGEDGLGGFDTPPLNIFGIVSLDMTDPVLFYYFAVTVIVLCIWFLWFFTKTPFGQIMVGMRDNAKRIDYLGYRVPHTKAVVYLVSGGFAGIAGAVYVIFQNLISVNDAYSMAISVFPIMMTMLGGAISFFGPVYGAAVFALLEEIIGRYTDHFELVLGIMLVGVIMYWPLGIAGWINTRKLKRQARKAGRKLERGTL